MRYWKPREAMKRPLLSPSEAAPACRSAQAETFGGYQLVDYGAAKELIAATIAARSSPFSNRSCPKMHFGVIVIGYDRSNRGRSLTDG